MKILNRICFVVLLLGISGSGAKTSAQSRTRTPVVVELFTSEGCSSCPPADRFLNQLDQQPIPGIEIIVLSEHVDYWNHEGWSDRFSASAITGRQNEYGRRFDLNSVYTPQMVVDGATQFGGSDSKKAEQAIQNLERTPTVPVRLSLISLNQPHTLQAHLETGTLENSFGVKSADVYIALALNRADSQISGGENSGRHLTHIAVLRSLTKVAELRRGQSLSRDVAVELDPLVDIHNLRVIAFVQEPHQGRILGAGRGIVN